MEIYEEYAAKQANFNDLPNELLWKIFHHLGYTDLLQMTLVCRRWNVVIFHFLNDRIRFHPFRCDGLDQHRTYRHLDLSVCPLPQPINDAACTSSRAGPSWQNAAEVRSIAIKGQDFHLDFLLRMLVNFKNLYSLDWNVFGKARSYFNVTTGIQRKITGRIERIQHLKVTANIHVLKNVLPYLSQSLVTLDVVLSPRALDYCSRNKISLPHLETLKMELVRAGQLIRHGTLSKFLKTLPKLRKFSFKMYDPAAVLEVTGANTNIEEIELLGLSDWFDYYIPDMSDMDNLRIFRTDLDYLHVHHFEHTRPMPQITTLDINQARFVKFDYLVINFPNITTLHMASLPVFRIHLMTLGCAYPALHVLSLQIIDAIAEKLQLIPDGFLNLIELQVNLLIPTYLVNEYTREISEFRLNNSENTSKP